jgi:hypothetical protein
MLDYGAFPDCNLFHGWLVGVAINNPASVTAWAANTGDHGGGIWGVGGVASDGANPFVTTGNTWTNGNWSGGEAVIRFQPGPIFTGSPADYWVPLNWFDLDNRDLDLGGSGPLLVEVPGATPSSLVVALGKDGNARIYLIAATSVASPRRWHRRTFQITRLSRQRPLIGQTRVRMLLIVCFLAIISVLSGLLQPIRP